MTTRPRAFALAALAAVLILIFQFAPFATAQDQGPDQGQDQGQDQGNYQDPPTRAGRIGYVQGSVSFQPGGEGDWLDAVPNRPLTTGDNLWADKDARAEVQIGSTSIRLAPETSLTFLDLGDNVTQVRLSVGSLFFRIRRLDQGESFEVDTPNLAFNVDQPGEYRIDVNENGDQTMASVWHGDAEITGGGSSYRLTEGQQGTFSGTDQLSYDVAAIGQPDDFSRWALDRDRREDSLRSAQYVPTDMTGYEDLDEYGSWHNVDGYGNVWSPNGVAGDWAPYRNGHWAYVGPWGWSWVEDEPWGFAPFHYGRWAFAGGGWCWVPGPVGVRPVYSPALVAFVGGGGFSVGVGVGGGVGWFPLGPGEVYVPWYRTSPRYVQNVNVTNTRVTVVQVTNVYDNRANNVTYINQRAGRGITVVNHDTFVNARPVNRNIERVDARKFENAPVTHEALRNIQPSRESVMGTAHQVKYAPPAKVMSRSVVATRQPVVRNRPAVPGISRTEAAPQVRTVKAAPRNQAESLNRGARGKTPGAGNAPANEGRPGAAENRPGQPATNNRPGAAENRPGQPENRPGQPENRPGAAPNNRPGAPENNAGRPNVPRPGNPNNGPGSPENRGAAAPRPGNENNGSPNPRGEAAPRPGAPENNNPSARPNAPEENRPGAANNNRNVPRPSSARPNENRPEPGRPTNAPEGNARPENPRAPEGRAPQPMAPENRSNAPENRPNAPETRPAPDNRPANTPPETKPSAPPQNRHEVAPPETRQAPAPRPETRNQPAPRETRPAEQPRQAAPPARPSERPQRESKPPESRSDKEKNSDNKDKDKQKFR